MKKILTTLLAVGFISSASAVSLSWTATGIAFGSGNMLKSDTGLTAYLIYLGNGGTLAASYTEADLTSMISDNSVAVSSVAGTTSRGLVQTTYNMSASDVTSLNGDVYTILMTYSSDDKTYYNLSSRTYTVSGLADETSTLDQYSVVAGNQTYTVNSEVASSVSAGGGWTAVPEPSTAALALAGLALLLKRRKA